MKLFCRVFFLACIIFVFGLLPERVFAENLPCADISPTTVPNLYQLIPGQSSVTLYFVPQTPFDGFTISYGRTPAADSKQVHFGQIPTGTAVKYTVDSLTTQGQYYFKVQATNGCAVGQWSNIMSSQNTPYESSLMVAGPGNILFYSGMAGLFSIVIGFALFVFL
jgi:hypothetical protein